MNDSDILSPYKSVAKMLVQTFGKECEVVLHDLRDPEHSVIHVENGLVTGREVGQSFTWLIRQVILSERLEDDVVSNYFFRAPNGKLVRSSTLLIRDEKKEMIGALCVNIDTTRMIEQAQFLQEFLPREAVPEFHYAVSEDEPGQPEHAPHVSQMIRELIDRILGDAEPCALSREAKLKKVRFMDEKGIFLVKGSMEYVAEKLGVSTVTVYGYLDTVRGKRG